MACWSVEIKDGTRQDWNCTTKVGLDLNFRRRYLVLVLGIIIMLSGTIMAASVQNGFGSTAVTEVDFQAADGSMIHSTLQKPNYATNTDPLPGVVVIHGIHQNKEWLMAFGIELARRGFVVLTIDVNGHGNSETGTGSGIAALDYITSLDYVDNTQIGLIGHSMGGGVSWHALNESSVYIRALVLVGAGFRSNMSYIPNTLLATGTFDSLSSYPHNLELLDPWFNVTGVVSDTTYGDFASNTARRAVFPSTNHLFETIDSVIVSESVEWMKNSLKGGVEDEHWIASTSILYPIWLVGGLVGLIGALLTIFPLIAILLDTPLFSDLKGEPTDEPATTKSFYRYGIVYGLIGVITFFPFLIVGLLLSFAIPFPASYGLPVMSWMFGSGLVALLILFVILRIRRKKGSSTPTLRELFGTGEQKPIFVLLKTLVLTLIVFGWLYVWTLFVDLGLALDLRSFLPGLHDLTLAQAGLVPLYFVVFLFYFLIEGTWLTGIMLPESSGTWTKVQLIWTVKSVLIKTIPYLILIAFEFVGGFLAGAPLVPDMIGFSWLFFYAFAPWFAVCTVITMFAYRVTGNRWLGAMVNAMLCAWLLATILGMSG
ncbi:MAG: 2-succinyl-6-hydroxy-2,4-cyclohexadiene-1-carboxylate synthase [Candidatus Thorarchaeota archaeon AB_25]|nr:MAG: 2-succinyl-6-hydroxy-2,4-cyclohexadiene-1-carboxylate synthase [Candidatus Thorarchaeota archaeon AB_25]